LDGGIGFDKNTTPFGAFGNLMFKSFESIMDSNHLTFRFTSHGKFGDGSYCAILCNTNVNGTIRATSGYRGYGGSVARGAIGGGGGRREAGGTCPWLQADFAWALSKT
jgi:hypothetical protein